MPQVRELGFYNSVLSPGPFIAITDVDNVQVGHHTLIEGTGEWRPVHPSMYGRLTE